jgi:hypothetical protein
VQAAITALTFNPAGELACIADGRAYAFGNAWRALVAPVAASSVAWRGTDWWLALPATGLVYKATGVPQSVSFEAAPTVLSARVTFTSNGEVYDLGARRLGRLPRVPSVVLDVDDATFALSEGAVYAITTGVARRQAVNEPASLLEAVGGAEVLPGLAARAQGFTYTVSGIDLVATNSAGAIAARVTLSGAPTRLVAGGSRVAVAVGATLNVYAAGSLQSVYSGRCGGAA